MGKGEIDMLSAFFLTGMHVVRMMSDHQHGHGFGIGIFYEG